MRDTWPMSFKHLTLANWREPDPVNAAFMRLSPVVGPRRMTGDDWAREFLAVELKPHVPEHIRDLFAVARGAMLYGWFFYPLFRLGEEQLYRVVEAAATARYRELRGPRRRPTFEHAINWLIECRVIPADDKERWAAVRMMRNSASHPERQDIMTPGGVYRVLNAAAHDINRLFARDPGGLRGQYSQAIGST
jgi:hypothetical protein